MAWGEDKMKVLKERLLTVLDDKEVQEKLRAVLAASGEAAGMVPICKEASPRIETTPSWNSQEKDEAERTIGLYKKTLDEVQSDLARVQGKMAQVSNERDQLSRDNTKLQKELEEVLRGRQNDQEAYQKSYQQALAEARTSKAACEEQIGQAQKELDHWKRMAAPFADVLTMYEKVQHLSPDVRNRVQSYFRSQTAVSFLVCVGQEGNLIPLWDIIKEEMDSCSSSDKDILLELLDYSIQRVNDSFTTPRYALRQEQIGARFDERFHIRSKGSSPYSDPIKAVILPGIELLGNGKVVKKSVVRV